MPRLDLHFDPIAFLIERKFPGDRARRMAAALDGRPFKNTDLLGFNRVEEYRKYLNNLSATELAALVKREQEAARREAEEAAERKRFFNAARAAADFDHWSKAAYWTVEEFVGLSLGKDPRIVCWESMNPIAHESRFAGEFMRRFELAERARVVGQLDSHNSPDDILAWAARMGIDVAPELIEAVTEHQQRFRDAEILEAEAKLIRDAAEREASPGHEGPQQRSDSTSDTKEDRRPLLTRERETVLKLILGMALEQYGYDPNAKKSPTPRLIADDLAEHGLNLDVDTVRKWLAEARDILPRDKQSYDGD